MGRGLRAKLRQPLAELGDATRRRVPAVAQGDDATERGRARAADPDRRMRLLHGPRREADVAKAEGLALEAGRVRRPQLLEHAQGLVAPPAAGVEGCSEDLELLFPPPHPDSADEPSVRQGVDARQHLGHEHGVAVAENEYRRAEPRPPGAHGRGGERGHRLEVRPLRRMRKAPAAPVAGAHLRDDDVIAHPERGDVQPLSLARERHQRVANGLGRLGCREMTADFHCLDPLGPLRRTDRRSVPRLPAGTGV